eukprot:TCONS_00032048-protein
MSDNLQDAQQQQQLFTYREGYLHKKEDEKTWQEYWVALRGNYLSFFIHKASTGEIIDQYCGCVKLNPKAKCITAKRKNYTFPFYLVTDKARYLFKTSSNLNRHQWFNAIEQAAQGKEPIEHTFLPPQQGKALQPKIALNKDEVDNKLVEDKESLIPDESEEENEEEKDEGFEEERIASPCVLINIQQANTDKMQSCFLNGSLTAQENLSFEDEISDDRLIERYREIYCNEETSTKMISQNKGDHLDRTPKAVTSYNYPQISKNLLRIQSQDRITRLTKSAESLRGLTLNQSSIEAKLSKQSTQQNRSLQSRKSLFSRHLIGSAPEVKNITNRHFNNIAGGPGS